MYPGRIVQTFRRNVRVLSTPSKSKNNSSKAVSMVCLACLPCLTFNPEDGGSWFLQNSFTFLTEYIR
jgi:hypothetical protein